MAERTEISWAHGTFNPWVGCTKISPACDHCYAESWAKRSGHPELWTGERRRTSASNWQQPIKWNRAAAAAGERRRVFCASLADVFDNQVPEQWRADLWALIDVTPNLDWLLLTKRPQNIARMLNPLWGGVPPKNVWLGITAEDQAHFRQRWGHLRKIDAAVRFISYEPALGFLRLWETPSIPLPGPFPDWIIAGGESGGHARAADPQWFRDLRDDCAHLGVAFHFKQWGGLRPKSNGCELDGVEHKAFPAALAA